ncbi:MAG: glycosyltransferase [Candidatus Firestonebacteria bacterium]
MKILFCSHEQFLPLTGGCTIGNIQIVQKMSERGHNVVISTPLYIDKKPIEETYKIKFEPFSPFYMHRKIKFRMAKYFFYAFLYMFHAIKISKKYNFDVLFVRNCVLVIPLLIAKKLGFIKKPIFVSLTDFLTAFLYEDKKYPKKLIDILFYIETTAPRYCDKIFVITPYMKEELVKRKVPADKIVITYDGADVDVFNPEKISEEQINSVKKESGFSDNIVLFHGTIELHHGTNTMKNILEWTSKKANNVNFLIIGIGKNYKDLQKQINLPNVKFLDFVPSEQIPKYIAAAKVGIIPYQKSYGLDLVLTLKLLEYLSMGTPAVTLRHKSIEEVFGKYDFLKIADSIEDFGDKILEALKLPKFQTAVNLIREQFSWDKVTTKICEEIESFK